MFKNETLKKKFEKVCCNAVLVEAFTLIKKNRDARAVARAFKREFEKQKKALTDECDKLKKANK
ncbi:MAG TPA: hypothetical protein VG013_08265 [Gemmataceae bacterium]|nr:hypothetical protein [Gemmataceae bacterium]